MNTRKTTYAIALLAIMIFLPSCGGHRHPDQNAHFTPLLLTIDTDQAVYQTGQKIPIRMTIKNISSEHINLADELRFIGLEVRDRSRGKNDIQAYSGASQSRLILGAERKLKTVTLKPGGNYTTVFSFDQWQIAIRQKGDYMGTHFQIDEFPNRYSIRGRYQCTDRALQQYFNTDPRTITEALKGTFYSTAIVVEVAETLQRNAN